MKIIRDLSLLHDVRVRNSGVVVELRIPRAPKGKAGQPRGERICNTEG